MGMVARREGGEADDSVGVKDVGGKTRVGWEFATFTLVPSAYVKMLSLSPSQVLPLQMPELSVRSGVWWWGGRGEW